MTHARTLRPLANRLAAVSIGALSVSALSVSALSVPVLTAGMVVVGMAAANPASAKPKKPAAPPAQPPAATGVNIPGTVSPQPLPTGPLEPTGAPTPPSYSTKDSFTFAVLGDTAAPAPGLPVPSVFFRIWGDLDVVHPDLTLHTGNFVWAKPGDQATDENLYQRFHMLVTGTKGVPLYIAPGNKDVPDEEADVAYRKAISGGVPWRSFDYGNSHFILLDSEVPGEVGKIAGDQLTWLQSDLNVHANAAHIFVTVHRTPYTADANAPAEAQFASTTDRDAFADLMSRSHVATVFSGGEAGFAQSIHDGVNYVNTGGGGGPTGLSLTDGGYLHYLVVKVDGTNVTVSPVEPNRIDVRPIPTARGFVVLLYNSSALPITLNRVPIPVRQEWRTKHAGLIGPGLLRIYKLETNAQNAAGTPAVDAAAVDLTPAPSAKPDDPDFLYFRVEVPAASAVTVLATENQ